MFGYTDELLPSLVYVYLSHSDDGHNASRQHECPLDHLLQLVEMNKNSNIAYNEEMDDCESHETWLRCG